MQSETDTELISHLIEEKLKRGMRLDRGGARRRSRELRGSFSIVVMSETEPDKLVAAKTATPMVLGFGEGENFIASDIPAMLEHTRRAWCWRTASWPKSPPSGIRLMNSTGRRSLARRGESNGTRWPRLKAAISIICARKSPNSRKHGSTRWRGAAAADSAAVSFETELMPAAGAAAIGRIVMLGAGASWITAHIGKFMIEEIAGVPVEVDYSPEFRYRRPPIGERTMMIAVSQSGETADTLAAMEEGRRARGASDGDDEHGGFLDRAQGRRAVIHAMRARNQRHDDQMLSHADRGLLPVRDTSGGRGWGGLSRAPGARAAAAGLRDPGTDQSRSSSSEPTIVEQIARKYAQARDFLFLGRGINYPVAFEGALKLKEISYIHAEGLFGRRDEAWPDRAHRRQDAGGRDHPERQRYSRSPCPI